MLRYLPGPLHTFVLFDGQCSSKSDTTDDAQSEHQNGAKLDFHFGTSWSIVLKKWNSTNEST